MKKLTLTSLFLVLGLTVFAQIPKDYYESTDGKKGDAALDALFDQIKDHTVISYNSLEPYYQRTDYAGDSILDIYSTCHFTMAQANCSQKAVCDCWNKEHSIPQSWFNEQTPMKSDLFHVYPTDARVNNFRSNLPYGEVAGKNGTGFKDNYGGHGQGKLGSNTFPGYSGKVFEPIDEFKGDLARTYFYMVARYRDKNLDKSSEGQVVFVSSKTNLTEYAKNLFLKWHRQDPVSQKEINRNDSVYAIQHNRNPFIDYPYLVEYIWGEESGNAVDLTAMISSSSPEFIPGVSDGHVESTDPLLICNTKTLAFPTVLEGGKADMVLNFQGVRLTHDVTISLSGANADCFAVSPASFTLATMQANSKQQLAVVYKPTSNAVHKATLTIASEGAKSLQVELVGACAVECNILWIVNCEEYEEGDPTTTVAIGNKVTNLPTPPTSCSETSKQFVGWTQKQIDGTSDETPDDLFSTPDDAPEATGDMRFYAVFSRLTETGGGQEDIVWSLSQQEGWTATGLVNNTPQNPTYAVFVKDASLVSPELDLATVDKIIVNMRTYGGASYNELIIKFGEQVLGKVEAPTNTLSDVTWINMTYTGDKGKFTFVSNSDSQKNGTGVAKITIQAQGTTYVYDQYLTSCGDKCAEPEPQAVENVTVRPAAVKYMHNGQLFIELDGHIYNILGVQIQ